MLYNKNNVRKANDKKVLHKVGKQWKVVSIALLMAIGGGAAVATHANAQSNNGVNASTSAEVEALEQKPAVPSAVSSAPSSVAPSSASAKPSSAISYQNGYNGSAASYHAKAMSDNSGYKVNNATVQHYVNSLNAAFPSATNSLNSNYTSAATKTSADQAAAQSYSAIANNKNYSSQVSTLASKAGLTYSGFVQSVSAVAKGFNDEVSYGSSLNDEMSTVNSYAQLINNIQSNSALSNEYHAKFVSASANDKVAALAKNAAESVYNHFVNASAGYQNEINDVKAASLSNSDAEGIARIYSGLDESTTYSLASELGYGNNSVATSKQNHSLAAAHNYNIANGARVNVFYTPANHNSSVPVEIANYNEPNLSGESLAANDRYTLLSDTSVEDKYNSRVAEYNNDLASYSAESNSVSSAVVSASAALVSANNSLSDANSAFDATKILGNNPRLNELFAEYVGGTPRNMNSYNSAKSVLSSAASTYNNEYSSASTNALNAVESALTSGSASAGSNASLANDVKATVASVLQQGRIPSGVLDKVIDNYNTPKRRTQIVNALKDVATDFSEVKEFALPLATAATQSNQQSHGLDYATVVKEFLNNPDNYIENNSMVQGELSAMQTQNHALYTRIINKLNSKKNDPFMTSSHNTLATIIGHEGALVNPLFNVMMSNNNATTTPAYLSAVANNFANQTSYGVNNLGSLASTANSAESAMRANGPTNKVLDTNYGILDPASYGYASNAVRPYEVANASLGASAINSVANSAASAYTSVESASNSYSAATEENVTLAGIYANSYFADANSDEAVESAAKNSLDNFYLNHADAKYANASSAAASFAAAEPNDAALAHANGVHVYNYAPKYIRVIRNGVLHSNTEYSKGSSIVSVPKNTQLTVLGVGFAQDGTTRYAVNYKGKKGYFTANVNYVTPAFLSAANGVSVTTNRAVKLYKNAKFTKKAGKTLPAGTTVPNVNVVSEDSIYGGFTRVETPSGDFFTANSLYVGLTGASANTNTGINDNNVNIMNNTNNGANNGANNGVGFWN